MSEPKLYASLIKAPSELELYKFLVMQYNLKRIMQGTSAIMLREDLLILMAIYLIQGYNQESKEFAMEVLKLQKDRLSSLNHDLKTQQYLINDPLNTRNKFLHPELLELAAYTKSVKNGKYMFCNILSVSDK